MSPEPRPLAEQERPNARALLLAGAAAGPLFYGLVLAQSLVRPGFSLVKHPLSLLSVGPGGWVQRVGFVAAGALVAAGAAGLGGMPARKIREAPSACLLGIFGAGTMLAGIFPPDAAMGFPPGTPDGAPAAQSAHSILHGLCFDAAFLAAIGAMFLTARSCHKTNPELALSSLACGIAAPALIAAGMTNQSKMGLLFFAAGAVAFGWNSAVLLAARRSRGVRAGV